MSVTHRSETLRQGTTVDLHRRALLIAYSFPPVGGAGVQRPAKWTKYLPHFGWDVTVLTPENPSTPLRDDSLLAEIPPETRILRAKTWEPDYRVKQQMASTADAIGRQSLSQRVRSLAKSVAKTAALAALQPDLQVLWVHNAIQAASTELRRVRHDAILVTAPPYSALLIGAALKKRFGLPLVFDFRDEWDLSNRYLEQAPRGWWSRCVQFRMQRSLLKRADAVIATTQSSAETYQAKLVEVGNAAKSHCIYNGFDPEDFAFADGPLPERKRDETFRLVYAGTLWNLTDIEPLVLAIERLQQANSTLLSRLEFVCVGRKTADQQRLLDRVRHTACRAEFPEYCRHQEVAGWLHGAGALCLTLADVPGAERVVPAKLFEYLAARKPILAIVPHGEAARLVRRLRPDGQFVPRDVEGIANWLADRLRPGRHRGLPGGSPEMLAEFSRPYLTGRLAEVLNSVVVNRRPRGSSAADLAEPSQCLADGCLAGA
jgi:glycosyltransferase involved in cell wall biosynthesis